MSDKVVVTKSKITAIANKIRTKLSSTDTYTLDDMPTAIESISGGGSLPDEQLVSHYDFTSANPLYDIVRKFTTSNDSKWGTLTTEEGVGLKFDSASSGIRTNYGLNWYEPFKIEFEFGEITYTGTATSGRKSLFCFDRRGYSNEGGGLCWNLASEIWQAYSGSGWQTADSSYTLNSFSNTTVTALFGVKIVNGIIYNGNGRRIYILDENNNIIVGDYQNSDYENQLQVGIGGSSNALQGSTIKSLKIYRLNNLEDYA